MKSRTGLTNIVRRKKTHEEYEQELFEKEINYIPLEPYQTRSIPILHACINDHEWKVTPANILGGQGCPKCHFSSRTKTHSEYLQELLDNDIDVFPVENYISCTVDILHECSLGHQWKAPPNRILKGAGCAKCNLVGGYNKTRFERDRDLALSPGILYVIVLVNKETQERQCLKIGITKGTSNKDVLKRAKGFKGYEPRIQKLVHGTLEDVFELEQSLHKKWIKHKYSDSHKFGGYTELFQIQMLPDILKSIPATL